MGLFFQNLRVPAQNLGAIDDWALLVFIPD